MTKGEQPQQVIIINGPANDNGPRSSCIEVAVAVAVAIIAGGIALALIAGAMF